MIANNKCMLLAQIAPFDPNKGYKMYVKALGKAAFRENWSNSVQFMYAILVFWGCAEE